MSSAKGRPFCLGLNVLTHHPVVTPFDNRDLSQHFLGLWWHQTTPKPGKTGWVPWHSLKCNFTQNAPDIASTLLLKSFVFIFSNISQGPISWIIMTQAISSVCKETLPGRCLKKYLHCVSFSYEIAGTSNHMHSKVWNEITYPFPNLNSAVVEVWFG